MTERCICTALRQAAAQSTARYDAALAPAGIKVTMFRLLRRLETLGQGDPAPEVTISDLAAAMSLDRSTLGRNLKVLERQDLIAMRGGTDGRARVVALTEGGRRAVRTALPLWRAAQADIAETLGPDTQALLDRLASLSPDDADAHETAPQAADTTTGDAP